MDAPEKIIESFKLLTADHEPHGWPAVRMGEITALVEYCEQLQQEIEEFRNVHHAIAGEVGHYDILPVVRKLKQENAELLKAEHDLSAAYMRIRELLNAFDTPRAPTPEQVWEHTEDKLKAQLQQVPNEHGKNRYGLDMAYFRNVINRDLNRPLVDYRPDELARILARMSRTADPSVMHEPEFQLQQRVPDGWQLAPIKPTSEMQRAAAWSVYPKVSDANWEAAWKIMLSTAPQPPEAGQWIRVDDKLPEQGQRVILKSNGVVQHYMPVFDNSTADESSWDFDGVTDYNPPVVSTDEWMPAPQEQREGE